MFLHCRAWCSCISPYAGAIIDVISRSPFDFEVSYVLRTHTCGELRACHEGQDVELCGWAQSVRDHGGLVFISLRDRYGVTQVVLEPNTDASASDNGGIPEIRRESAIRIWGRVTLRPEGTRKASMPTGDIEVIGNRVEILGQADPILPVEVSDEKLANEETRLRYRYIDLRRPSLQRNMEVRHKAAMAVRNCLSEQSFLEIQTPMLVRSTPEGARDFVVPSRNFPGMFYALPQSPQLYKQMLMVSGFDRYFQLAQCFRDEDLRADRQLVHTQIDLEMSFCDEEDVYAVIESVISAAFKGGIGADISGPFLRLTYDEAMERFGSDKPDMRFGMELNDVTSLMAESEFGVFKSTVESGGRIRAIVAPGCAGFSRKEIDELTDIAKVYKAKGLVALKVESGELQGSAAKYLASDVQSVLIERLGASHGDLLLLAADTPEVSAVSLGQVRRFLGRKLGLVRSGDFKFLWVTEFPLFEWNPDDSKWDAKHHIFTMPRVKDIPLLEQNPAAVKGRLYDLVLNGVELGSGSIRINTPELQKRVLSIIGTTAEEADRKFGFLLRAYEFGGPVHGGFAVGFDRLIAVMLGLESLRDVIAFPQNASGVSMVDDCPNRIDKKQWDELHIRPDGKGVDGAALSRD